MADKKLSQLPQAVLAAGTDIIPIVRTVGTTRTNMTIDAATLQSSVAGVSTDPTNILTRDNQGNLIVTLQSVQPTWTNSSW